MELQSIRCFQHCLKEKNIFCFNVPPTCPLCHIPLSSCPYTIPPFCLPSPFYFHFSTLTKMAVWSSLQPLKPFSVVVKPTQGNFLRSYRAGDDLHVGLVDSNGIVYNYNEYGVLADSKGWDLSLCVNIFDERECEFQMKWNESLKNSMLDQKWDLSIYEENSYNCYEYVIDVLSDILSIPTLSKETFTTTYLLPETIKAAKYISLYHEIQSCNGIVVHNVIDS